uniref:Uncharacterized protein n=1 Tax=Anguilla anguilla TaxID=7936 RepID=A0A0E9QRQ9_ANGAN
MSQANFFVWVSAY